MRDVTRRLDQKVACITGATSDIGFAIARRFVEAGARVLLLDILDPEAAGLGDAFADLGDRAVYRHCDVSVEADVSSAVADAVARWGSLTTAVAAARWSPFAAVDEMSLADFDKAMAVNARGAFYLSQSAIAQMVRSGGGSIIFISSVDAMVGRPNSSAYCASKGAMRALAKGLATEYASAAIRVNSVHPGVIMTRHLKHRVEAANDPLLWDTVIGRQPGGKAGHPDDIAWPCVYLASDEAGRVTGTELLVDCCFVAT